MSTNYLLSRRFSMLPPLPSTHSNHVFYCRRRDRRGQPCLCARGWGKGRRLILSRWSSPPPPPSSSTAGTARRCFLRRFLDVVVARRCRRRVDPSSSSPSRRRLITRGRFSRNRTNEDSFARARRRSNESTNENETRRVYTTPRGYRTSHLRGRKIAHAFTRFTTRVVRVFMCVCVRASSVSFFFCNSVFFFRRCGRRDSNLACFFFFVVRIFVSKFTTPSHHSFRCHGLGCPLTRAFDVRAISSDVIFWRGNSNSRVAPDFWRGLKFSTKI